MNLQESIRRIIREVRVPRNERVELYKDENIIVVVPLTHRALQKYATNCQWCINDDLTDWEEYHKGKHAVIIQRNPKKSKKGITGMETYGEIFILSRLDEGMWDWKTATDMLGYDFGGSKEKALDYYVNISNDINNFATNIVYYSPENGIYDQEDNFLWNFNYEITDIPNVTPEVIKIMDDYLQENEEMSLQESIRRILKEERNISDIIKIAAKEYNCSTWEINNGYCEDFALNVLEKLGGYEDNLFELSGDMFFNQRDPEFAKENWGDVIETNYGVWSKNLLDYWGYPPNVNLNLVDDEINHVWLFYNGKHYDAEVPEGVDNWFEIPLIKRLFNRYKKNMVQESIIRILKEETDPKKGGLLNIIQEDGLYNFTKDTGLSYNDIYHRIGELPREVKIQYLKDVVDDLQQFPGELDLTFITGSIPLYENDDWQMVYAEYLNNDDNVLRVHLTTFDDDNRDEYDTIHEDDIDYETLETLVSELSEKLQYKRI